MYAMKNLGNMKTLGIHASEAMKAFVAFDRAALAAGALPAMVKELMAIAVALTTQCPYCIELHSIKARELGATDPEIAETVLVAAALRAGGAITHGTHTCTANGFHEDSVDGGVSPAGDLVRQSP
jgi:AhpD family alkylhydroperoxidase